ncbi:MAG: hypothetical protein U0V87_02285 [Acidobacteriota bacterium]
MTSRAALVIVLVVGVAVATTTGCNRSSLPSDASQRTLVLMEQAWGPESADTLQKFLKVRQELKPVFEANAEAIEQHSLREASTRPLLIGAIKGLFELRRVVDSELKTQGLTMDDYQRLTILVYGRWLRSVRTEDPPEKRITRVLQELEVAVSRRVANDLFGSPKEKQSEQDRLASIRHQLQFVAAFGLADKSATLARIDGPTKSWLEQHRKEIEDADFGLFDTAAPERTRPKVAKPTGVLPVPSDEPAEGAPPPKQ